MMLFVGSQSFTSLPSFIFVSAAVSEINEVKQNKKTREKKNSEIGYFHLHTFTGYPFFKQRYLLSTCTHSIC